VIPLIVYISSFSILVPVICGLFVVKSLKQENLVLFYYYILLSFFVEAASFVLVLRSVNNHVLANVYVLFEFILLTVLLIDWLKVLGRMQTLLLLGFFTAFWAYMMVHAGIMLLNADVLILERLILMILSGYFLLRFIGEMDSVSPFRSPRFWIATGILVYFTSTIIVYSLSKILTFDPDSALSKYFSYLSASLNLLGNSIYAIGFLCKLQNRR
jgi:hypothetical protein